MTEQQAIDLAGTRWWEGRDALEIALFFFGPAEGRVCLPFEVLHHAVETALGRPVYIHEFGSAGIQKELLGEKPPPSFDDILALVPSEKVIIVER